jgi:hypothetical protein
MLNTIREMLIKTAPPMATVRGERFPIIERWPQLSNSFMGESAIDCYEEDIIAKPLANLMRRPDNAWQAIEALEVGGP